MESTRVLVVRGSKALGAVIAESEESAELRLVFFAPSDEALHRVQIRERLYLGKSLDSAKTEHFVAVVIDTDSDLDLTGAVTPALASDEGRERAGVSTPEWADLRVWGHAMSERDTGLFTQALALANWHATHRFSPTTGESTEPTSAGWVRTTPSNRQLFPRTDVAVIVLVTDDRDRILLGNNAMWEPNRFSLLAGYVDPGESLEAAVEREVFEESGLQVDRAEYKGSQPWPFPASLMVGFVARVRADTDASALAPDGEEILSLRWFTREELRASLDDIVLPGRTSIARSLIEDWFGEPLEQNAVWLGSR